MNIYDIKRHVKSLFFVIGLLLVLIFLIYTENLVKNLKNTIREDLSFKIEVLQRDLNENPGGEVTFIFEKVIKSVEFPIAYTDQNGIPIYWRNLKPYSSEYFKELSQKEKDELMNVINNLDKINKPLPIKFDTIVLGYYHYGNHPLVDKLRRLPYVELLVILLFIAVGYFGFHSIMKNEKRLIWVGMAKEAAHQLGTPISSLMGWVEYLKSGDANNQLSNEIYNELLKDINRLKLVSERFSGIGSIPSLKPEKILPIIEEIADYFRKRKPQKIKTLQIDIQIDPSLTLKINRVLFIWVMENLIKNAMDAINHTDGKISISSIEEKSNIILEVKDNGNGIPKKNRKKIFKTGFSTKKRGWGIGLALAHRIIVEYHRGDLVLYESEPGIGSTFRIYFKRNSQ